MYFVTWEDAEGMFVDDPQGYDSEIEARNCAAINPAQHPGQSVVIYRAQQIDAILFTGADR